MGKNDNFFDRSAEQSEIKTSIINEYFSAWMGIIRGAQKRNPSKAQRVHYMDLYCGKGTYGDGKESTPVKVMRQILANDDWRKHTIVTFNDHNSEYIKDLEEYLKKIENYDKLKYKPRYHNSEVNPEELVEDLQKLNLVPTFCFLDPFGYKGLSAELIDNLVNNWGTDCIIFFNFNRINMGINNDFVRSHMDGLFGPERRENLSKSLKKKGLSSKQKEDIIINEFAESIKSGKDRYVLAFSFPQEGQNRTSHHLIYISKSFKGYEVMKEIMFKYSQSPEDGINGFGYTKNDYQLSFLDQMTWLIADLSNSLLRDYEGQSVTRDAIYKEHSVNTRFVKKHYNSALKLLEKEGKLTFSVQDGKKRRANSYPPHCKINFPVGESHGSE